MRPQKEYSGIDTISQTDKKRACYSQQTHSKLSAGQHPANFIFNLEGYRNTNMSTEGTPNRRLQAYAASEKNNIQTTNDPVVLIKMLFDKACLLARVSMESLRSERMEDFEKSSLHALQIVLSLRFVLKTEDDDQLATSLFETYTAIAASLLKARENKDLLSLEKIYDALNELREAWAGVLKGPRAEN